MDHRTLKEDPFLLFDQRIVERNVRAGYVTRAELEQHMSTLADKADRVVEVPFDEHLLQTRVRAADFGIGDTDEPDDTVNDD